MQVHEDAVSSCRHRYPSEKVDISRGKLSGVRLALGKHEPCAMRRPDSAKLHRVKIRLLNVGVSERENSSLMC